ncbi:MAG: class I poly(R)-hydroxyalkanoic acid synthase [Gammaproteobacteria bacterium]|nr:class I poly(R)-hydroxyalkanoic acid synthase [Gammaproteobacteria bacterium]
MNQSVELSSLIQDILCKSGELMARFEFKPEALLSHFEKTNHVFHDLQPIFEEITKDPKGVHDYYLAYAQETQALLQTQLNHWSGIKTLSPTLDQRRFNADEWRKHPFFLLISQHYLLMKAHVEKFLAHIDCKDHHLAKRAQFLMHQFFDALSPENFLLTNPQVLAETVDSQGMNLLRGLQHFLQDIDAGSTRWVMPITDRSAFKVGHDLATTPGKVIFRNELMELIQYLPQTKTTKAVPLLIIPPWINKYYILDLSPANSLVKWLVSQGITVFMISWRNPVAEHAHMGLAEYVSLGPVAAIETIQQQLNVPKVSTLGFCIGGTLQSILLAYYKERQMDVIASSTFLASLIDFSEPGDIGVFIHEQQVQALEQHMNTQGYLEGEVMATAFNSLRATDLIWAVFVRHYLHGQPHVPFDLLFWNSDTTNMPAAMHSEYLRGMYLENNLIKPGKIKIHQKPINVGAIDVPAFFLSTQKDHIAPWQGTYRGFQLLKGPKTFVLGGSGHIAGIVIPPGKEKYGYYTNASSPEKPDDWFKNARSHTGSWWPEWLKWLKKHSGKTVKAATFVDLPISSLGDAPGKYVHE